MKKLMVFGLLLIACSAYAEEDQKFIDEAKKAVTDSLKDPESARFRNIVMIGTGKGKVACGEVNAKNTYGGYVGFKKFYKLENSLDAVIKGDGGIIDELIDIVCKPTENIK